MANSYWNNVRSFLAGTKADGGAVDDKFDGLGAGLDGVDLAVQRSIKIPLGETGDQVLTQNQAGRIDKAIGFDNAGDLTLHPNAGTSAIAAAQSVTDCQAQVSLAQAQVSLAADQVTLATAQVSLAGDEVTLAAAQVTLAAAQVSLATAQTSLCADQRVLCEAQAVNAAASAST
ncbi:MAG: hypothetical protein R8M45_02030, partial [Ghiorsea sp.]